MNYRDTEKFKKTYNELYEKYKDSEWGDIMYLYTLHNKSSNYEGDFHFIGKEVCRDILRTRWE